MPFSFFKKSKPLFGANIEPNCEYCKYNMGQREKIVCLNYAGGVCKKYSYEPTKRQPMPKPVLKEYSEEEFTL